MEKGKGKCELTQVSELGGTSKQNGSLHSPQWLAGSAEQLIPGLQNDIVLKHIVPKLPWRDFHVKLSSVSSYWRRAIKSGQVHDARARLNSLETLVVMNHMVRSGVNAPYDGHTQALSLYDSRKNSWHELPKFPFHKTGIPPSCQCVALQGSLYVLGSVAGEGHGGLILVFGGDPDAGRHGEDAEDFGSENHNTDGRPIQISTGREVFVLDLAGQRGWKCCADLPKPTFEFACGVLDGKIYVLGGYVYTEGKITNECWVYDPKQDHWSSIAPMLSTGSAYDLVAVRDELWVHDGWMHDKAIYAQVYNPALDEWAYLESKRYHASEHFFTVKGKPYLIRPDYIHGLDESSESNFGPQWQSIRFNYNPGEDGEDDDDEDDRFTIGVQPVDHELFVLVVLKRKSPKLSRYRSEGFGTDVVVLSRKPPRVILYRSEGFGTDQEVMYLNKVEEDKFNDLRYPSVMCAIDL